jgi:hypothetical protein
VLQDRACRQPASRPVVGTAVNRGPTSVRRSRRSARGTSRERGARPEEPPPVVGPKQLRRSRTQPPTRPQAGMPNATRSQGLRHHLNNPSLERGSEQCLLSWTGAWEGRTDRMTVASLDAVGSRRSRQSLPAAILSIYPRCIRRPMRKAGRLSPSVAQSVRRPLRGGLSVERVQLPCARHALEFVLASLSEVELLVPAVDQIVTAVGRTRRAPPRKRASALLGLSQRLSDRPTE